MPFYTWLYVYLNMEEPTLSKLKKFIKYRHVKTEDTGYIPKHYIIINSEGAYCLCIDKDYCKHTIFILKKQGLEMFEFNFKFLKM